MFIIPKNIEPYIIQLFPNGMIVFKEIPMPLQRDAEKLELKYKNACIEANTIHCTMNKNSSEQCNKSIKRSEIVHEIKNAVIDVVMKNSKITMDWDFMRANIAIAYPGDKAVDEIFSSILDKHSGKKLIND